MYGSLFFWEINNKCCKAAISCRGLILPPAQKPTGLCPHPSGVAGQRRAPLLTIPMLLLKKLAKLSATYLLKDLGIALLYWILSPLQVSSYTHLLHVTPILHSFEIDRHQTSLNWYFPLCLTNLINSHHYVNWIQWSM